MKKGIYLLLMAFLLTQLSAQEEPLTKQLKSTFQKESLTINALIQAGFWYSMKDDNFQGGRTFKAANARLSFKGKLDNGFFYRVYFNLVNEPNLLDAYIGYTYHEGLRVKAGAMKPKQTLDYIPNPGSTDFIDRTTITSLLVQGREIGLSAEGNLAGLYYFTGIFNGNKHLSSNNNNKFYGIGRIQYSLESLLDSKIQMGLQGSHGNSVGVQSGKSGPMLRGERTIYGADLRWESDQFIWAMEYLEGLLETATIPDKKEKISGYYVTTGYKTFEKIWILARWQSWAYKEMDFRDHQLSFGIKQSVTSMVSYKFGFDAYFPEDATEQYGLSLLLQIQF